MQQTLPLASSLSAVRNCWLRNAAVSVAHLFLEDIPQLASLEA